jgi:hypothetical protein
MKIIRLPKPIGIAERVMAELLVDRVDTESVQSINTIALQRP